MRIGIACDLRSDFRDVGADAPVDCLEEYDSEETVEAIQADAATSPGWTCAWMPRVAPSSSR